MLVLSSSDEVDIVSLEAGKLEDSPPLSPAFDELVEAVTHAVVKLYIDWLAKKQEACRKSKLDEHFLPS